MKKVYIGIDPDLRLINCALISGDKEPLAIFSRTNSSGKGDMAVQGAARCACRLVEDVIGYLVSEYTDNGLEEIITIVESQSMLQTKMMRDKGRKVNYEDICRLAQVAGVMMGAFSNLSQKLHLVQPVVWKGTVPKDIAHKRYYRDLGLTIDTMYSLKNIIPTNMKYLCAWSEGKINPGDFMDINDSLGLALYGAKKGL